MEPVIPRFYTQPKTRFRFVDLASCFHHYTSSFRSIASCNSPTANFVSRRLSSFYVIWRHISLFCLSNAMHMHFNHSGILCWVVHWFQFTNFTASYRDALDRLRVDLNIILFYHVYRVCKFIIFVRHRHHDLKLIIATYRRLIKCNSRFNDEYCGIF